MRRVPNPAPNGEVLEQDPLASPPADKASLDCSFLTFFCSKPKVTLTVSNGPRQRHRPQHRRPDPREGDEELEEAGFAVEVESSSSNSVEEGLVIHSEPSGGESATKGSAVTLFVSSGPKQVKVPVLVGTQRSVAVQQIRGRGLVPAVSEEESDSPAGEVISQSPSAGGQVPNRARPSRSSSPRASRRSRCRT